MDELEKLLNGLDSIISKINEKKTTIVKEFIILLHAKDFENFKDKMNELCKQYQFRNKKNTNQNRNQLLFYNIICEILKLGDLIERVLPGKSIISSIVNELKEGEYNYLNDLSDLSIENVFERLDSFSSYIKQNGNRERIVESLNSQSFFEADEDKYLNSIYTFLSRDREMMEGNALVNLTSFIAGNFMNFKEEDLKRLMNRCENIVYDLYINCSADRLEQKKESKSYNYEMEFFTYVETVLKIKSIFYSRELKNDFFVKEFFEGRIENDELACKIIESIPMEIFYSKLGNDKAKNHFYREIVEFFRQHGFSDKQISNAIRSLLTKTDSSNRDIVDLIMDYEIDTDDSTEYNQREKFSDDRWLMDNFETIVEIEYERILNGDNPFLRADYYVKTIEKASKNSYLDDEGFQILCEIIIEMLNIDFYNAEEKKKIRDALNSYTDYGKYLLNEDEKNAFRSDVSIEKEKNLGNDNNSELKEQKQISEDVVDVEIHELTEEDLRKIDYNGMYIPLKSAKSILMQYCYEKETLSPKNEIRRLQIKLAIKSIVYHRMKNVGLDISVFFGSIKNEEAMYLNSYNSIWLNIDCIEKMIEECPEILLKDLGHEMDHAIANYNKSNMRIDYNTFLDIESDVIRAYYPEFYADVLNHSNILGEINADIEGFSYELEQSKDINSRKVNIKKKVEKVESLKKDLYSKKQNFLGNIKLGNNSYQLDLDAIFRRILNNNPEIFEIYNGIFKIKYNPDGTEKDINTLLKEFERTAKEGIPLDRGKKITEEEWERLGIKEKGLSAIPFDYLYSIYSGIINHRAKHIEKVDEKIKNSIEEFEKMNLVSVPILHHFYYEVDPKTLKDESGMPFLTGNTSYEVRESDFLIEKQRTDEQEKS